MRKHCHSVVVTPTHGLLEVLRLCQHPAVPKDAETFFAELEKKIPAVIALGGEERVFLDDALQLIRDRTLEGGLRDFNWDRVSGKDKSASAIAALARTLPMMAARRLVEVRDAEGLSSDLPDLEAYLDAPSPDTVVLLLFGNIDLRDKLPKLLDKKATLVRFDHPKERDMPRLVSRRGKRHGLSFVSDATGDAAEALALTVGADLTLLERALEKLALATSGQVTLADVAQHVADTRLEDAFAFVRNVAMGDRGPALQALARLQAAREEPIRLLGLLAWQLRQVLRAALLQAEGRGGAVGAELNLFGDRLMAVQAAVKRFATKRHIERLSQLWTADRLLKSSRQPEWLIMTRLVEELCVQPAKASVTGRRAG